MNLKEFKNTLFSDARGTGVEGKECLIDLMYDKTRAYYGGDESGHGFRHICDVLTLALLINEKRKLESNIEKIIIASFVHDMFSSSHRSTHHIEAHDFVLSSKWRIFEFLSPEDRIDVAMAVKEHRASGNGEYHGNLSVLISAADRGYPDMGKIIKRIRQCAKDTSTVFTLDVKGVPKITLPNGEWLEELYNKMHAVCPIEAKTYTHLYEKYSDAGYAQYNFIYKSYFDKELTSMYKSINKVIDEKCKEFDVGGK